MSPSLTLLDNLTLLDRLFRPVDVYDRVGLAVSGGADSLALMVLAHRWAVRARVELVVYSVDHGLRPEARDEVAAVLAVAAELGLKARALVWSSPHPTSGIQEAARNARYGLIGAAMADGGVGILLTAHHRQDQAETVLMRLAHGSGVAGLAGMTPLSNVGGVPIFRPLLDIDREDLRAIVAAVGLVPFEDPSNQDTRYERVRWRNLLPQLDELGLDARRLGEFAQRMGQTRDALASAAETAVQVVVTSRTSEEATIDRIGFARLPRAVAVVMLSRLLAEIGSGKKSRVISSVEALYLALVSDQKFGGQTLHGCMVRRQKRTITIGPEVGRRGQLASQLVVEPNKS
ncbi:tRNA lysidine(34) synthetase TilS [Devosia rhodophyticola]|uniref:tRNA(Ile)-lysidine synthase n=1 Tax=Devosia rhodophyticola TaxID=3026423 RepID=A0ABY7YUE8_9HYPH|nr:tRNA lysidine(34) synthetase TilS [Devosia rhodophyticola]WDR04934.1 tRNA lysidine(34) synthetase TilS [Devosia rhodophyticola]